jgi:ribosomal protein L13E
LSSSWVTLIFSPVNERTGRVASWEVSDRGFTVGVLSELGLKIEEESFGFWLEEVRKIEDEKNERHGGVAEVAIFQSFELCVCERDK